ncbi:FAD-binding protein [Tessaracoccus massiliensis]|uniref:FAD-binding protein n=1 Tax=Tessaracoccus massiliensis TaxID=1522311 RepID=UPI000693BF7B|nr:FAD-binding protein [Tessaracoccus massiliensis]
MLTDDFWLLSRAWSTVGGMVRGAKFAGRVAAMLVKREKQVASGGFDRNARMREEFQGVDGTWTSGADGNLGGPIEAAERIGAAVDLMDDAWWGGSIPPVGESGAAFLVSERAMPFSIIVDGDGNRFANEAESYVDLGHHMIEHPSGAHGQYWMICDARHGRRYLRSYALDPKVNKARTEDKASVKARTLDELADKIGVDRANLKLTVERFNGFARTGIDHDFGRGNSAYDRYYSDPRVRPNPNLGPIEKGPFEAVRLVPGDLGTKGGVMTDASARVLRGDGSVIVGLYASGNCSASVMGRTYPGPGSTLGPAVVFGYIAAKHIAGAG